MKKIFSLKRFILLITVLSFSVTVLPAQGLYGDDDEDEYEASGDINQLIKDLKNSSPTVRMNAADALADMGPEAQPAVPALAEALVDKDGYVRNFAANALGQIGPGAIYALPALIKAMKDKDPSVSQAAEQAIGTLGPAAKSAIPHLIKSLKKWESSVQESPSAYALISIGKASISSIAKLLENSDKKVVLAGIWCLGEINIPSQRTFAALAYGLNNYDPEICEKSAMTLRKFGVKAVPTFIKALSSRDSYARKQAAWSLGRLPRHSKRALNKLKTMGKRDTDPAVKAAANWAAGEIKKAK